MKKIAYSFLGVLMLCAGAIAEQRPGGEGDKAAIKAIEQKWDGVLVKGDIPALDAILGETFTQTDQNGNVLNKAELLAQLRSGELKYLTSKVDDMTVFLHGDAAVVTGRWAGRYLIKGKTVNAVERYTDTWIFRNGQWRCVAYHGSANTKKPVI